MYRRFWKRILDILISGTAFLLLSPLLLLVSIAIRLEDGGPPLFRQTRVGRNEQSFTLLKFRSMPVDTQDIPSAEATTVQITRVGAIIRRTNIDELPQLINILKGDMSVVGPRPALVNQDSLRALRRHYDIIRCTPGLTGLAQVNSYDGMSEEEKANWDRKYCNNVSLITDMNIILRTFVYLLKPPPTY